MRCLPPDGMHRTAAAVPGDIEDGELARSLDCDHRLSTAGIHIRVHRVRMVRVAHARAAQGVHTSPRRDG